MVRCRNLEVIRVSLGGQEAVTRCMQRDQRDLDDHCEGQWQSLEQETQGERRLEAAGSFGSLAL